MKFKAFVIFFLLTSVIPDVYLLSLSAASAPLWAKILICLPSLVTFVCVPLSVTGIRYTAVVRTFSWFTFIFEVPKLLTICCSAVFRYLADIPPQTADMRAVIIGSALSLFFIIMIFIFSRQLKVNTIELKFPTLPQGLDGIRICQLSDLHVGSFGKAPRYIKRIVDKTLALSPELILFTGDLVNFRTSEVEPFREELLRLKAPMGIFSVRGNHDYLLHGHHNEAERLSDTESLLAFEEGLGWMVLRNQNVLLRRGDAALAVAGVENVSSNPFFMDTGGDLQRALEGIPEGVFTILMSHDPSHWRREIVPHSSVPLTLSGHTHGLKIKFVGLRPAHWRLKESGGVYREKEQCLHVSEGLGSAFAFRIGSLPRIDLIVLKR